MNGIICDCGEFLNPTHRGEITDAKIYSCTCGLKWFTNGKKQKKITNGEFKRMSYQMDKY